MTKRLLLHLTSTVLSLVTILMLAMLCLAFYVPRLETVWAHYDTPLATWKRWLVGLSQLTTQYGAVPLGVLLALFAALLAMRIVLGMQVRRERKITHR